MSYSYQVVRWPFAYTSATLTVNKVGGGSATTSIATGTYICDGSAAVVAPIDFVRAFQTAINAAMTTLGGTAQITASLDTSGHLQLQNSLADGSRYTLDFNATLEAIIGATSADYFSGKLLVGSATTVSVNTMTYQMQAQWHPGIDADYDSGDLQRQIVSEGRNLKGRVRRVVRSYQPWDERRLDWSRIAGGRMSAARAATAAFATVAGIATGEDNTWENMWRYLTSEAGPYADNRVYVYSTNDPATAVRSGPYDVALTDSEPGLAGLPAGGYVQGMASEHYAARLLLVEAT